MDKNTITGIILIFAIFIGFSIYNSHRMNKSYKEVIEVADSLYAKGDLANARAEYINALRYKPNHPEAVAKVNEINRLLGFAPDTEKTDSVALQKTATETEYLKQTVPINSADSGRYGAFGGSATGESDLITLENDKIELKISTKGGRVFSARLKEYRTYDSLPLILFSGDSTIFGFNFYTIDNKAVQTNELYFKPVSESRSYLVTSQPQSVRLRLMAGEDKYIEYKYTLAPDKYMVDFDVTFKSMEGIIASNQNSLTLDWRMYIPQQEKGRQNEENYTSVKYKYYQDDVEGIRLRQQKDVEKVDISTKLSWIAFKDQFFSSVLISKDFFLNGTVSSTKTPASEKYIRYFTSEVYRNEAVLWSEPHFDFKKRGTSA
jgi:YidC/Oxa1 family membrane protein insertase